MSSRAPEPPVPALQFGVSQAHGNVELVRGAAGFVASLAKRLGEPVELFVAPDYEALLRALLAGTTQIAWLPPLLVARAIPCGAQLAAVSRRGHGVTYRSALVVRKDAWFARVGDLRGARAAWSDRQSASAYVFPRLHLAASGVSPERDLKSERFYPSKSAACAAVADDQADFCACHVSDEAGSDRHRALADVTLHYPDAATRLRVLDVTRSIPPDGIVLGPTVYLDRKNRIVPALLRLHEGADGQEALRLLLNAERLISVSPEILRIVAQTLPLVARA